MALDRDPLLLAALAERARAEALDVEAIEGDATRLELGERRFALIAVPMQTIQLLSPAGRRAFLVAAARHLLAGGRVAIAIADALEGYDDDLELPLPDLGERDGWRFVSQPVAVRDVPGGVRIERVRQAIGPALARSSEPDAIVLAALTVEALEAEGRAAGLEPEPARHIPATQDHVASEVVILRA